jgi:hypothetical protein
VWSQSDTYARSDMRVSARKRWLCARLFEG